MSKRERREAQDWLVTHFIANEADNILCNRKSANRYDENHNRIKYSSTKFLLQWAEELGREIPLTENDMFEVRDIGEPPPIPEIKEFGNLVRQIKAEEEEDTARLVFSKKEWDEYISAAS